MCCSHVCARSPLPWKISFKSTAELPPVPEVPNIGGWKSKSILPLYVCSWQVAASAASKCYTTICTAETRARQQFEAQTALASLAHAISSKHINQPHTQLLHLHFGLTTVTKQKCAPAKPEQELAPSLAPGACRD
jgi:hypothetical protein